MVFNHVERAHECEVRLIGIEGVLVLVGLLLLALSWWIGRLVFYEQDVPIW